MDNDTTNDVQQATAAPEAEQEQTAEVQKPFGDLSDDEQQDVLREAFFGNIKDAADDEDNADEASDSPDGENAEKAPAQEEQKKEDSAEEPQASEAPGLYTPEEFLLLSPDEVDASRLPDAARIVHERDLKWFNETIAPQLQELQRLKAQQNQPVQQPQQTEPQAQKDAMAEFNAAVKKEAARRLGVNEIDEFNADHNIMVSLVTGEFQREAFRQQDMASRQQMQIRQAQDNYARTINEIRAEYGNDFGIIDRYALQEINNLPFKVANQVMDDLRSGDPARIKNVYKQFVERYKASRQPAQTAPKKEVTAPPKVIGGSGSDTGRSSGWGLREFKAADSDAKTRMIQEMFFNDK